MTPSPIDRAVALGAPTATAAPMPVSAPVKILGGIQSWRAAMAPAMVIASAPPAALIARHPLV
jgi:hypothetical protein